MQFAPHYSPGYRCSPGTGGNGYSNQVGIVFAGGVFVLRDPESASLGNDVSIDNIDPLLTDSLEQAPDDGSLQRTQLISSDFTFITYVDALHLSLCKLGHHSSHAGGNLQKRQQN